MAAEHFRFPLLNYDEGTPEQVAQRLAAHQIAERVNHIENEERATGWEATDRPRAFEVARYLRRIAGELFAAGTKGLEARVKEEIERHGDGVCRVGCPCRPRDSRSEVRRGW